MFSPEHQLKHRLCSECFKLRWPAIFAQIQGLPPFGWSPKFRLATTYYFCQSASMPDEAKILAEPRKRILSLDGGGVRGVFTIEILARMEELLRVELKRPNLVLADHFHLVAGTSTGAIIATLLSWGKTVAEVRQLYADNCRDIFPPFAPWKIWRAPSLLQHLPQAWFSEASLIRSFKRNFKDSTTGDPAHLGSADLKTYLLLCMRNSSKDSAWPLTNNPKARYNQRLERKNFKSNLDIPLWKIVRASTAAPFYFLPEAIKVEETPFLFVDGGMTPYNNPALIAYLTATLPCYEFRWPTGIDKLHLVSIGTGHLPSVLKDSSIWNLNLFKVFVDMPGALMDGINKQQDFLCRVLGSCIYGENVDSEVRSLIPPEEKPESAKNFTYVRYDHVFDKADEARAAKVFGRIGMSNIREIPFLTELGREFATQNVDIQHLL